jgi:DNA-binding NtrC family response regulator
MRKTILIVDDDAAYGALLSSRLRQHSLVVQYVTSAKDALELLFSVHFDAVITDIYMPDCDGIELLKQVRRHHPGVSVIGMTSDQSDLTSVIERIFKCLGGAALIAKPSFIAELLAVLAILPDARP